MGRCFRRVKAVLSTLTTLKSTDGGWKLQWQRLQPPHNENNVPKTKGTKLGTSMLLPAMGYGASSTISDSQKHNGATCNGGHGLAEMRLRRSMQKRRRDSSFGSAMNDGKASLSVAVLNGGGTPSSSFSLRYRDGKEHDGFRDGDGGRKLDGRDNKQPSPPQLPPQDRRSSPLFVDGNRGLPHRRRLLHQRRRRNRSGGGASTLSSPLLPLSNAHTLELSLSSTALTPSSDLTATAAFPLVGAVTSLSSLSSVCVGVVLGFGLFWCERETAVVCCVKRIGFGLCVVRLGFGGCGC
ncbi:hypothetical protein PIB30_048950 [Stylosanthes scabra]|uniref:Uncharacterized protein n=1 Tax=Stylosanthes scabra TaxID=79078 RepID=A0ABU6QHD9_9FABA|nr:hypothetical protein [Stylosanthes scabra]